MSSSFVSRYCQPHPGVDRGHRSEDKVSFTDDYIAERGDWVHKLKARDSTGRWAYYFVMVNPFREKSFLDALKSQEIINLEDFGSVIASCYGECPNDKVKKELSDRFGFSV